MGKIISQIPAPEGAEGALIKAQDLGYKTIREDWNIYELEDGTTLKAKLLATKILRGLDEDEKSIYYLSNGEPAYNIRYVVSVTVDVPADLLKK
jgi:hypothetical protein